ncbi:1-hydroxycarotenoid 3,4-desaturase [Rhodobium orientis]|uniref:CrtD protein n=1 Tax=Rhodobium orientis TaxID=34017 RepID=A0A327JN09_9HYPH|nr:1-hydroxycarotenoid 3,4-desaturase CrtD [Rhodobium orientis]MBB4303302.1 1-hydroxycarotenoid 3,4-desaturase [Rhodobium orientis]MBK5951602.1 CrtD protein [Rhodobium orientis]RAI27809.1 CrtD protein [Rhodobium orientis]
MTRSPHRSSDVVIVGAGMGGLAAAVALSARGMSVRVIEKADAPGGKIRTIPVGGVEIDSGPTVMTMKWVFDELLEPAGTSLEAEVGLETASILARHGWQDGSRLDLFADTNDSHAAIAAFADRRNADGYLRLCEDSARIYKLLQRTFIADTRPNPVQLASRLGAGSLGAIRQIKPFSTLWKSLGDYFPDKRLRQLFGRYATYCGSSPYEAPATLMLISHVEQDGVWLVKGGMHQLPLAIAAVAERNGARFDYGRAVDRVLTDSDGVTGVQLDDGEVIEAGAVIFNGDMSALAAGKLGEVDTGLRPTSRGRRSLSAMTWSASGVTAGFPLSRHNVFFSNDYKAEFDALFKRRAVPREPTVYICAQGRNDRGARIDAVPDAAPDAAEPLFFLINAPAIGDAHEYAESEIERCLDAMVRVLERCGLTVNGSQTESVTTTPTGFARMFPATGGALYGPASHGWMSSFQRPGAKTNVPGLYMAGGSVHPGPGIPMAALSGRIAAETLIADRDSTPTSRRADTSGGTSTD